MKQSFSEKKGLSRRDFMKASSLTAGGLLLGSLPVSKSAYAAGSDKIKVALVGCGGRGTGAAVNFMNADDGVQLVAMADLFEDRLNSSYQTLSSRYGDTEKMDVPAERRFFGFDAYKKAIAEADAVILCEPPGFRPASFRESVEQGKHVFMEKPVAVDAPGVRSVLESGKIAKEKGLNVVVGLQRRYQTSYREIFRRIANREVGDLLSGQVYWNMGYIWVNQRQEGMSELYYQIRNWYYFTWLSGDHIAEQHIHQHDVANWFLGGYPVSAQGMGGREVRTGKEYGQIFDHHFVEYKYANGAVVSSQCRQQPNTWNRVAEDFIGTRGFITLDGGNVTIRDRNNNVRYRHDGSNDPNPYQQEIDEMVASIRSGNVIDDTEFGAKATLTSVMGRMATYSGRMITWDDAMNSTQKLVPDTFTWNTPAPIQPDENGIYPIPVPGETNVLA